MKLSDAQLEKALALNSAQEVKNFLALRRLVPTLPQAKKLTEYLHNSAPAAETVRLGILHTYTSELLDPWLALGAALNGLKLDTFHAPYGVTFQEAQEGSDLQRHNPDITLLLLRREDMHPALQTPAACLRADDRADIEKNFTAALNGLIRQLRANVGGQIIVSFLPSLLPPGLGLFDTMSADSEQLWWNQLKSQAAAMLTNSFSAVSLMDMDQLLTGVGRDQFFDLRLWYSSVFPFSTEGAFAISRALSDIAASLHLTRAKVIALDADNTLWGGIIGEDGLNGIALGPEYPGRPYQDFQRRILEYQRRGFILALCSKNNPDDLNEVFESHPHQVLKHEHFAAERVNWLPKPDNLKSLAQELNLGLDSFIFIDDSDHECAAVRQSLPEVQVVQVPSSPIDIPRCLDALARLEITSLTEEDLKKTTMYSQERQRKSQLAGMAAEGGSLEDYLKSLNMKMLVGVDDKSQLPRLSQLTQKTNQFNLTTRRYSEQELAQRIEGNAAQVYHFSLADNFGDSGIVGLAIVERHAGDKAHMDTFLMSCRVIGRQAEIAFLRRIIANLKAEGVQQLSAEYIPTRKNVLVETFLPDNAFTEHCDGQFITDLDDVAHDLKQNFPIEIVGPKQP